MVCVGLLLRRQRRMVLVLQVGGRAPLVVVLRRVGVSWVGRRERRWGRRVPLGARVGGVRWRRRCVAGAGEASLVLVRVHGGVLAEAERLGLGACVGLGGGRWIFLLPRPPELGRFSIAQVGLYCTRFGLACWQRP